MIAVTFALPVESRDLRRVQPDNVEILHTGVGEKICRERIGPFLDANSFELLITSGFAGGLDPSLGTGDLLLAENFSDPNLLEKARALLGCRVGKLATVGAMIASPGEREQIAKEQGAAAVDMETQFIAEACAQRKLPMLSLRAISDTAAKPLPLPSSILFDLAGQKTDGKKLSGYLLRHPLGIVRLVRFSRQIAFARARLTNALHELLRA